MKPGGSGTRRWTSSTAAPPCWMTKGREPMSRATDEVYREESSNGLESVEIDSRWGPVEVMASPGDDDPVKIRAIRTARSEDELEDLHIVVERRHDSLLITVEADRQWMRRASVAFQVSAPADLHVHVETSSSDI